MRFIFSAVAAVFILSGCVTTSGNYVLTAQDASGKDLTSNMRLMAHGSGIYSMRNALCAKYPKAIVTIKDSKTGEELGSESPYQCR